MHLGGARLGGALRLRRAGRREVGLVRRRNPRRLDRALSDQGIEHVVDALADQRKAGHQQDDRETREEARPPDAGAGVVDRALQVISPLGRLGGLDAVAEEAERREGEDRVGGVQRRDRRHALDHVVEDVAADDRPSRRAERAGGLHVGLLADADHVVSHHPEVLRYVDDGDRRRGGEDPLADRAREQEGDHDRQQQIGEGEQRVHDQDQRAVQGPAHVAGEQSQRHADRKREHDRQDDHLDGRARAPDHPREHVCGRHGGPHQMLARWARLLREPNPIRAHLVEPVGRDQRREDRQDDEQDDQRQAADQQPAGHPADLEHRSQEAGHPHRRALPRVRPAPISTSPAGRRRR